MPFARVKALLLGLCLCASASAQQLPARDEVLIASSLVAESRQPAAGTTTTLAVLMEPQGDWHGYWKQPGDVGLEPQLSWHLPEGVTIGEPAYPVPTTLLIDGLMNHVYKQPYAVLLPLRIAPERAMGSELPIRLDMSYLACRYDACVPEQASIEMLLRVGDGRNDPAVRDDFATWRQALPRPLGAQARFEVADGMFRLSVPLPASLSIDRPHLFAATPGVIDNAAPQRFERKGDLLIIETTGTKHLPAAFEATLALDEGLGLELHAVPDGTHWSGDLGVTLMALAGAVLGGLLLNLMPCVFPILSLKALSIARANTSAAAARGEALAYGAGVVTVCILLGGLLLALRAGGAQVGWAFQLQDPRVILVLLLLSSAIAFNLAGLFELSTINAGAKLTAQGGRTGAFWTGALAAFVATPCTGPFMAAALGTAMLLPAAAALLVFAGLGIGIALPFLLLGFVPALRRRLPKPGPWMATLRRILAVPMFLTALALVWVLSQQVAASTLVVGIACTMLMALGLWMTGLRQRGMQPASWLPAVLATLLALAIGLSQATDQPAASPQAERLAFDEQRLAALREGDKPVFVYFTADWCVTCKVNEQVAIDRHETTQAFNAAGVTVMRGDWTRGDAGISAFLERHGRSGIPFYLWYRPGQHEPQVLPQILTPGLLRELARH